MVGQDIIDLANARLQGYQNGLSPSDLMSFINEGKDEVWTLLKSLNQDYFETTSQSTDNAALNYFGPLSTVSRDYTLPADLREIKLIEITDPTFVDLEFLFRKSTDPDYRDERRYASVNQSSRSNERILYTIIGQRTLKLASFPPANVQPVIWYVKSLPDFEPADSVDDILVPYSKKIADYAVKKGILALQDPSQFEAWKSEWHEDILSLTVGASPRNQSDIVTVIDFEG